MEYEVRFDPVAEADPRNLYNYVANGRGHRSAQSFVDRIIESCNSLSLLPERGMRRNDIIPGLRIIGIARTVAVASVVLHEERTVLVLSVFYGGRDYEQHLGQLVDDDS